MPYEYYLSRHVYADIFNDEAVLLDARNDEYLALDRQQVSALASLVEGWPPAKSHCEVDEDLVRQFAEAMLSRKLLTRSRSDGRKLEHPNVPPVTSSLMDGESGEDDPTSVIDVVRFVASVLQSRVLMQYRRPARLFERIARRRARNIGRHIDPPVSEVRRLTNTFFKLRPFLFSHLDKCLLDSLALVEFLALHHVYATLVIGIRPSPFGAHAWVQYGSNVLTSTEWYVRGYRPIVAA